MTCQYSLILMNVQVLQIWGIKKKIHGHLRLGRLGTFLALLSVYLNVNISHQAFAESLLMAAAPVSLSQI